MLPPDNNDIFDKLRHSVAVSGSDLPIHKEDEPPPPPPPPMPYDEADLFDVNALQGALASKRDALIQSSINAQKQKDREKQRAERLAKMIDSRHRPINPVVPHTTVTHTVEKSQHAPVHMGLVAFTGFAVLLAGGSMVAEKKGWMNISGIHLTGGQGQGKPVEAAKGMVKVMQPPPPDGPSLEDIQTAAGEAVTSHYAAQKIGAGMKATLNTVRIVARQPSDAPETWQVLMTLTVRMQGEGSQVRAPERKEGFPEKGQSAVIEVPRNGGSDGAPPSVPFISAPLPPQKANTQPSPEAAALKKEAAANGAKQSDGGKQSAFETAGPPPLEPQPRWVSIHWSGERWFLGDYEFD